MTTIASGVYFIENAGTGTVIDLKDGSNVNGTDVQGYTKRTFGDEWVPPQLWVVNHGTDGTYTIQDTNSRTYLDLRKKDNGTPIEGYGRTSSPDQKWVITHSTGTSYVIQNKATGTYVDLNNGNPANGTKVQGWAGSGPSTTNKHQLWKFVRT